MLKKAAFAAVAVLCLCVSACGLNNEQAGAPTGELSDFSAPQAVGELAGPNTPIPIPVNMEIVKETLLLDTEALQIDGSWSYLSASALIDGRPYLAIVRENLKGDAELLLCAAESDEEYDRFSAEYVEGSLEESGGSWIYFAFKDAETGRGSIAAVSIVDGQASVVLGEPCSGMVVFPGHGDALSGLGFAVLEDSIVTIKLSEGSAIKGMTMSAGLLGGLPEINGSFFDNAEDGYDYKAASVSGDGSGVLLIEVTQRDESGELQEKSVYLSYDCIRMTMLPHA